MATTAGEINVKLGLNSDSFIKSMDDAERELQALEGKLKQSKKHFEAMSKAMAVTKHPTEEMRNAFAKLKKELQENKNAYDNFQNRLKRFDGGLIKSAQTADMFNGALTKLFKGFSFVAITKGLIDAGKAAVNTAAQFEKLAVSFEVLAGGAKAGQKLTNQIVELASKTPLTTEALSDGARTLLSFGESANNIIDDLKLLGDITGGDTQRMQSLTLAFAQIGSTGKLAGQDLLQMINAGFNPLEQISKTTGKSMAQLKDEMSKGLITFKDVKQAMKDATAEGGRFYGMMNKQSETLEGRLSTLSDSWQLIKKNIGDFFLPAAKAAVAALNAMAQAVLNLMNKIHDFGVELRGNTVQGQLKKAAGFEKEAKKYSNLAAKELERANALRAKGQETRANAVEERANAYLKHSAKFAEAATRAKTASDALKAADKNTNNIGGGFDSISATGTSSGKGGKTDKALEAYKKYIQEYSKLNDDYAATLKARQYVEGTLGLDPIKQQEDYDKALAVYQAHLSKMAEIKRSGAINQASIEKLEQERLAQDIQELKVNKEKETQRKIHEITKGYNETGENISLANVGVANSFLGGLSSQYRAKLDLEIWYQQERKRIIQESNNDLQLQTEAFTQLDTLRTAKLAEANLLTWEDYGRSVSSVMSNTYTNLITGQENFGDAMKNLARNMLVQLLQMLMQYVMKELAIRAVSMFLGGSTGGVAGMIFSGLSSTIQKHHSGGMIPGTKEQVAVLQGGERVLNRSEAASYNSGEGENANSVNNIMVFNIKAWDGRDVIDTLKANEQTINQIVSSGIKNNKQGLRMAVQNV